MAPGAGLPGLASGAGDALERVQQRAEATLRRVEALQSNLSGADSALEWQQQYNAFVLAQRVREELDKKQRFVELERREAAREERLRKEALEREVASIRAHFARLRTLREGGPEFALTCYLPFGRSLLWRWDATLEAALCVGSHGFLGLYKYGRASREPAPTLVDFCDLLRDANDESAHEVVAACFCAGPDGRPPASLVEELRLREAPKPVNARHQQLHLQPHQSQQHSTKAAAAHAPELLSDAAAQVLVVLLATASGKIALALVEATRAPELQMPHGHSFSDREIQEYRTQAQLFENNPSAQTRALKVDLETEGLRWLHRVVLADRAAMPGAQAVAFLPGTNLLLVAGGSTIHCYNGQLRQLWTLQPEALLSAPKGGNVRARRASLAAALAAQEAAAAAAAATAVPTAASGGALPQPPLPQQQQQQKHHHQQQQEQPDFAKRLHCLVPLDAEGCAIVVGMDETVLVVIVPRPTEAPLPPLVSAWLNTISGRRRTLYDPVAAAAAAAAAAGAPQEPLSDEVLTANNGARVAVLAKLDSPLTCAQVLSSGEVVLGAASGKVSVLTAGAGQPVETLVDHECIAGQNGELRTLLCMHGTKRVLTCDSLGHLRYFVKHKLQSLVQSVAHVTGALTIDTRHEAPESQREQDLRVVLPCEDGWAVWRLPAPGGSAARKKQQQ